MRGAFLALNSFDDVREGTTVRTSASQNIRELSITSTVMSTGDRPKRNRSH